MVCIPTIALLMHLKCINQSIVILTGETEPEGEEIASAYIELNPAIEHANETRKTPSTFGNSTGVYRNLENLFVTYFFFI